MVSQKILLPLSRNSNGCPLSRVENFILKILLKMLKYEKWKIWSKCQGDRTASQQDASKNLQSSGLHKAFNKGEIPLLVTSSAPNKWQVYMLNHKWQTKYRNVNTKVHVINTTMKIKYQRTAQKLSNDYESWYTCTCNTKSN